MTNLVLNPGKERDAQCFKSMAMGLGVRECYQKKTGLEHVNWVRKQRLSEVSSQLPGSREAAAPQQES